MQGLAEFLIQCQKNIDHLDGIIAKTEPTFKWLDTVCLAIAAARERKQLVSSAEPDALSDVKYE
tara:strand:+ start:1486 stop:1677 length:192 start_codon:yes stop_codon:yes gene_type:complete